MTNQMNIHTGFAGTAKASGLAMPVLGRVRTSVAVASDANQTSLAVRLKP